MAHRLQLSVRKPIEQFEFMLALESFVNDIYKFYGSHGHKTNAHLREFAKAFDEIVLNYNYIFKIRWVSSEANALSKITKTWSLLNKHLTRLYNPGSVLPADEPDNLNDDTTFSETVKSEAKRLHFTMLQRHLVTLMHFLLDVLNIFAIESKQMQRRDAVLIGQEKNWKSLKSSLKQLKTSNAHHLNNLLADSACSNIARQILKYIWKGTSEDIPKPKGTDPCKTLSAYEKSPYISWNGAELSTVITKPKSQLNNDMRSFPIPPLSEYRNQFIDLLIGELDKYFPVGSLKLFEVFDPSEWPKSPNLLGTFGLQEIAQLCNLLDLDDSLITTQQWTVLIKSIRADNDFWCLMKESRHINFWSSVIGKFNIEKQLLYLIKTVLILPIGSADAERAFSIMNHIRTKRRSQLSDQNMEALLRIRLNGPNELERFNPTKYSKLWTSSNHVMSDGVNVKYPKLFSEEDKDKRFLSGSTLF
jgi:hypothetical protein